MTPENDKFLELLSDYDGTAQDRQKKFLVENYGYDSFMSLNDMEYAKLEELGYDGSLNDKWHKYIIALGGSGLGVKAQLLSSTFYVIIDPYKVNNFSPELTTDFISQYYRTGGSESTLTQTITHNSATAGNATMTGGYGPELVTNGDGSTLTGWTVSGDSIVTADGTFNVQGGSSVGYLYQSFSTTVGKTYIVSGNITATGSSFEAIRKSDNAVGTLNTVNIGQDTVGRYSKSFVATASTTYIVLQNNSTTSVASFDNVSVREIPKIQWRPHNLLTYSEDFSDSDWSKVTATVTANAAVAPDGTNTADTLSLTSTSEVQQSVSISADATYTVRAWVKKSSSGAATHIRLSSNNSLAWSTGGSTKLALTDDWQIIELSGVISGSSTTWRTVIGSKTETGASDTDCVGNVDVWGAHLYRSDLGGMADVPAAERVLPDATTYVRTAGRVIGSELVTNGTFDTDTDWTTGGSWSISGGQATQPSGASAEYLTQSDVLVIGKHYQYSIDVVSGNGSNFPQLYTEAGAVASFASGTGTYTGTFTAAGNDVRIRAISSSLDVTVDNISIKEIDVDPSTARYLPRIGHHVYNGSQWVNEGLLHESEQRVNLVTYSNEPNNAGFWNANSGISVTLDSTASPAGLVDGSLLEDTATLSYLRANFTLSAAGNYCLSFYAKANGSSWIGARFLGFVGSTANSAYTSFDLANGVVGTDGNVYSTIEDVGNGWYRCSIVDTIDAGDLAGGIQITLSSADDNRTVVGDGTSSVYIYGAQVEAGSTPSSYIPTSGATVTRAAETLTIEHENLPWPSPVVIGDELVTNGTFDTDVSGWNKVGDAATTFSYSSGRCLINAATTYDGISQTISGLTVGAVYKISVDYELGTSARVGIRLTSAPTVETTDASGTLSDYVVATSTSHTMQVSSGASTGTLYVDNISVKEINPLSVSIAMDGRMTYADEDASAQVVFSRWQVDSNTFANNFLNTNAGTGQAAFAQRAGSSFSYEEVKSDGSIYAPDILVPFSIASRHGSTFVNGAVDGVALTADTTPTALPDLETTDLSLGYDYMGTIGSFRVWANDIADAGIVEASEPSTEPTLSLSFDGTATSFTDFEWSE